MAKKKAEISPALYDVIERPVITEKSQMATAFNQFVFIVASWATKTQIKQAVEAIFEVKVKAVNVMNVKGKAKTFRGTRGRRKDQKKAIITLESGQNLDLTTAA